MSGQLFCIFCSWSTTMYKPETIACHIEYYYHLTPYWPHPTMHTQASFSMYEQWCTAFHSVVWQLTAIGEECAKHAPIFVLELLSASLPSTSSHQVGIIWPVGYWEADRRHYITPSTKQSADVMLLRKTDFCAYFTITMADVCSSSCNSRHVDNHVYVLIPGCHLILSKIKAESMYHGVSFFTIYKNKNFIWQHVVWLLVCFCNCGSFYLERMCIFIES